MSFSTTNLAIGLTGLFFLLLGLAINRLPGKTLPERIISLAPTVAAAALAAFGAEHFAGAQFISAAVPRYLPNPYFFTYLVGAALIAAALALACARLFPRPATLAATCTAIMLLLFDAMIHIPNLLANPHNRIFWNVATRELTFACGFLAYALGKHALIPRILLALTTLDFGIQNILFNHALPGVPLEKLSPPWLPAPQAWTLLTGLILIAAGAAFLTQRYARPAAALSGLWQVVLTLTVYMAQLILSNPGPDRLLALNYIYDTTLYAATFLLAAATTQSRSNLNPESL